MDFLHKIQEKIFQACRNCEQKDARGEICSQNEQNLCDNPKNRTLRLRIANDKKFTSSSADLFMNLRDVGIDGHALQQNDILKSRLHGIEFVASLSLNAALTTITIKLEKAKTLKEVIANTLSTSVTQNELLSNRMNIIFPITSEDKGFLDKSHDSSGVCNTARILALASHMKEIMEANLEKCQIMVNQCQVSQCKAYQHIFKDILTEIEESPTSKEDIKKLKMSFIEDCKTSRYRKEEHDSNQEGSVALDLEKYIKEKQSIKQGKEGFDQNLKTAAVVRNDGDASRCLEIAATMEQKLCKCLTKSDEKISIISISTAKESYETQMAYLVWNILSIHEKNVDKMALCCCGACSVSHLQHVSNDKKEDLLTFQDYVRLKSKEIGDSFSSRYGPEVEGKEWENVILDVTAACIRFDLLSCPLRNNIRLNINGEHDEASSSRKSIFVLYNYSRLSTLLTRFEDDVKRGIYPPLPSIDEIDFSLLREEQEWRLFIKYVLFYSVLVVELGQSVLNPGQFQVNPPTNKACAFLSSLSRDISSYYHQTKVLLDPRPHLFALMFARIYLIKALKQVMQNAFKLIGVNPPSQM